VRKSEGVASSSGENGAGGVPDVSVIRLRGGEMDQVCDGKKLGEFCLSNGGEAIPQMQVAVRKSISNRDVQAQGVREQCREALS